jgi:large subunit ribosomal protein L22
MLTERGIARDIRKVLRSAVANAVNNDEQDASELYVIACFADEGSTLRRFRPRARGRATRIRKRTCHITVIVARMSDERLAVIRARAEGASASADASRRARVERSRQRAEEAKGGIDAVDEAQDEVIDESAADDTEAPDVAEDAVEGAVEETEDAAEAEAESDDEAEAETETETESETEDDASTEEEQN